VKCCQTHEVNLFPIWPSTCFSSSPTLAWALAGMLTLAGMLALALQMDIPFHHHLNHPPSQ
jgi:hypothetical protein